MVAGWFIWTLDPPSVPWGVGIIFRTIGIRSTGHSTQVTNGDSKQLAALITAQDIDSGTMMQSRLHLGKIRRVLLWHASVCSQICDTKDGP